MRPAAVRSVLGCLILLAGTACSGSPGAPAGPAASAPAAPAAACADAGGRVQRIAPVDPAYGDSGDYTVYLPPCYDTRPALHYPVLVLLHGAGHDEQYWPQVGIVGAADTQISSGAIHPMIIVLPDGGPIFHSDLAGAPSFQDYLVRSVLPDVERRWRTSAGRANRAIGGISLGGGTALQIAAAVPAQFGSVGGHSPTVGGVDQLAAALDRAEVRIYLDVGDQDSLRGGAETLAAALTDLGVHREFHVGAGTHDESYWSAHLTEYVAFYDAGFTGGS